MSMGGGSATAVSTDGATSTTGADRGLAAAAVAGSTCGAGATLGVSTSGAGLAMVMVDGRWSIIDKHSIVEDRGPVLDLSSDSADSGRVDDGKTNSVLFDLSIWPSSQFCSF